MFQNNLQANSLNLKCVQCICWCKIIQWNLSHLQWQVQGAFKSHSKGEVGIWSFSPYNNFTCKVGWMLQYQNWFQFCMLMQSNKRHNFRVRQIFFTKLVPGQVACKSHLPGRMKWLSQVTDGKSLAETILHNQAVINK